jgi:hypothetical protein
MAKKKMGGFLTLAKISLLVNTNKEIYASVKNLTLIETIRLNRLRWFGHVQRMEGNRIVCVGLDMYREWKKIELYVLVWTCTESGRK